MNKVQKEINNGRKRLITAAGVIMLLAAVAISLNAASAFAAWDSPMSGGKAPKKNQVAVTETVTASVTGTAVSTATRTPPQGSHTAQPTGTVTKVSVCHRTGSQTNPYVLISVSTSALAAHQQHGDIYPAPQGGCPQGTPQAKDTPKPTKTARPAPPSTPQAKAKPNNGNGNGNNGNGNAKPAPSDNGKSNGNGNNGNGNGNNGNNGKKGKP